MTSDFSHNPVMLTEVVEYFQHVPSGVIIDATLGGGGHSEALLRSRPDIVILGIDQDEAAIEAATARLAPFGARVDIVRGRFDDIESIASQHARGPIVGVLFDFGVSSPQFDVAERGFSYQYDGPLDMRMDQRQSLTAQEIVNTWESDELIRLFKENGERFAVSITNSIITNRPIGTTAHLVDIIKQSVPAAAQRKRHPARHVFQALRIAVNNEIEVLADGVKGALQIVVPGGRIATLAYHSGEDRTVKELFVEASTGGCACPDGLPCVCGAVPIARLLTRGSRKPSQEEIERNSRSKAARFRAVEMLAR